MFAFSTAKGRFGTCFAGVILSLLVAMPASTEQLHDVEQFLQEHHISITEQTVIAALRNEDPGIRRAAAQVLSSRWPRDAAEPIEVAMWQEDDELIRVSLATDLARLGDSAGRKVLLSECHNPGNWGSTRMFAARSVTELHDDSCVESVLEILGSDSDPQDTNGKMDALYLVPSVIKHFTAQEYQKVLDLAVNALNDPDLRIRLTASIMLGGVGDTSVMPALQAAIASEQDQTVHSAMLLDLKRLSDLQRGRK